MTPEMEVQEEGHAQEPRLMQLSVIVTVARNGVIGINGCLPVRLPADRRRFRIITSNKPIIMGRKTHEAIGRSLPNRTNIVLSRSLIYPMHEGAIHVKELTEAYEAAYETGATHTFVIGGLEVFKAFLPVANKIYLTVLDEDLEGDTFFPVPVEAMLKWNGKMIQSFGKDNPSKESKHSFYILDVPELEELAQYYENPLFEGT